MEHRLEDQVVDMPPAGAGNTPPVSPPKETLVEVVHLLDWRWYVVAVLVLLDEITVVTG